jgi:AcrR family transcriptional regulator
MTEPEGRRERKKAQTRKAIADAALELFSERGYDNVGVREVADAADVALSTLFKHFPSKESLVFDLDTDLETGLADAIRERKAGQSVIHALRDHLITIRSAGPHGDPLAAAHLALIQSTPALKDYSRSMWLRHENTLAAAIAEATHAPAGDLACAALARFALASPELTQSRTDPQQAMRDLFSLLEHGWANTPAGQGDANPSTAPPGPRPDLAVPPLARTAHLA